MSILDGEEPLGAGDEEGESLGVKVINLEGKVHRLENAVSEISSELRAVLTDVRTILSDLENPINFLRSLGIDEVMISMAEETIENKLKEFIEKKLDLIVKTSAEGKLKELVDELIKQFVDEQLGMLIESKVKELKEQGVLTVPIDANELKAAMEEKLSEVMKTDEFQEIIRDIKENARKELEELVKQEVKETVEELVKEELEVLKEELKEELPELLVQSDAVSTAVRNIPRRASTYSTRMTSVGLIACASTLVHIAGKKGAEQVVEEHYRRGKITDELRSILLRTIAMMNSKQIPEEKELHVEDHIVLTYLFEKLAHGASDLDFLVILSLSNRLNNANNGGPPGVGGFASARKHY